MALGINTSSVGALSAATNLIGSLTGLLVASPTSTQGYLPQNKPSSTGLISLLTGPPSLIFHYEGEQTATFSSDITDHFLEDNTAVQDQISLKPVIVTTHGFIGELNNVPPQALQLLQQSLNTLTAIGSYSPSLTASSLLAYNKAFATYQLAANLQNAAVSAISSLGGSTGESVFGNSSQGITTTAVNQNQQQKYFQQLIGYWQTRTLFTIQTPWVIFQNMVIQSCRAIQDGETKEITDFEISWKQMSFANSSTSNVTQGRAQAQTAPLTNNGNVANNPTSATPTSGITGMLKAG